VAFEVQQRLFGCHDLVVYYLVWPGQQPVNHFARRCGAPHRPLQSRPRAAGFGVPVRIFGALGPNREHLVPLSQAGCCNDFVGHVRGGSGPRCGRRELRRPRRPIRRQRSHMRPRRRAADRVLKGGPQSRPKPAAWKDKGGGGGGRPGAAPAPPPFCAKVRGGAAPGPPFCAMVCGTPAKIAVGNVQTMGAQLMVWACTVGPRSAWAMIQRVLAT
jgi:hypothetical protein